jgi:hypothetical protein
MKSVFAKSACQGSLIFQAHRHAMSRIGAGEGVHHVDVAFAEAEATSGGGAEASLDLGATRPTRSVTGARLADDELVLETAPCTPVSTTSGPPSASRVASRASACS